MGHNRLQPTSIAVTQSSTTLISLGLGYGTAGSNNGNLMSPTISPLGVTENFTYDAVNRLWTASASCVVAADSAAVGTESAG